MPGIQSISFCMKWRQGETEQGVSRKEGEREREIKRDKRDKER